MPGWCNLLFINLYFQGPDVKSSNFIWGESLGKISPQQWTQRDVDLFNGLNNDILAREGLVALDMKHSVSPGPVTPVATPLSHSSLRESMTSVTPGPAITHIKQDMMYPVSMASPTPPNSRQVTRHTSQTSTQLFCRHH